MRTTVNLADDVAREVERLRREEGLGISEAVNMLARRGMTERSRPPRRFTQRVHSMGRPRVRIDDVAAVLDAIEGESRRG